MRIINPSYEIIRPYALNDQTRNAIYKVIELAGRTCYKSENKIAEDSASKFVARLVKRNHLAMLEHAFMTVRFVVDRGISHELVRHRMSSFAQESTRYCNYASGRFDGGVAFIDPSGAWTLEQANGRDLDICEAMRVWTDSCAKAESMYEELLDLGANAQMARTVLPTSLKTEVVITANLREWRHILSLRAAETTGPVHPQMLQVMVPLLVTLADFMPEVFADILERGKQNWTPGILRYFQEIGVLSKA